MNHPKSWTHRWLLPALLVTAGLAGRAGAADASAGEFFETKVRPVLVQHCYSCHSAQAKKVKGGLLLDSREGLLKGGESGPVVTPGEPTKSRLITAVEYKDVELLMPPRGKIPAAAVADLIAWVKMGVPWPAQAVAKPASAALPAFDLNQRQRDHWAWQPVRPTDPPVCRDPSWCRDPADAYILAGLEAKGLRPAPAADRRTWLRRVTFDLTGLPPTAEEIDAFLADESPRADEKVVDRLLGSLQFGERWARHWLDLVRYGESRGHEFDPNIPNAYQYRDYVIRAFNADVPYDQFVREHLAGDLLPVPRRHPTEGFNESILGTGFWSLGEEVHSPVDVRQDQADRFDNRIDVMTKTFLGLTVACARCHDHKFDAISTKDYYALFGFLSSSSYRLVRFDTLDQDRRVGEELAELRARTRSDLRKAVAAAARPAVRDLATYLLAAREAVLAGVECEAGGQPTAAGRQRLAETARSRGLDVGRLTAWVAALKQVSRDPADPLGAWARAAADPGTNSPQRLAEVVKPLAEEMRRRAAAADAALAGAEVIVDYGRCSPADWLPDGPGFGPSPARVGDVRLSVDPARRQLRFLERAAAESDRRWDGLRLAPGAEADPGALGKIPLRAGRTLSTPTFKVKAGKVHYLVRGAGLVYASVGAHVQIAGPLHGQLVMPVANRPEFHWVTQDLSRYRGLDAHVEFTPNVGSEFAVAMVVQGEQTPGPVERPLGALQQLLTHDAGSAEALAAGYERIFSAAVSWLETDEPGKGLTPEDAARLTVWLVKHPELLGSGAKSVTDLTAKLQAEEEQLAARIRPESRLALALRDGNGVNEHVFIRGSPKAEGELVPRRFLEALAGTTPISAPGSGRLELARQVTDPRLNPFIGRVLVNRVWHHLFGRGIVASTDNFGVLGERPTHPELLDHLADRFIRESSSVKQLIRSLVLSSTYRMTSQPSPETDRVDPGNLLLHRARLRRLEGEAIRDALLSVSGRLDRTPFGPSVPIYLTPFLDGRGRPGSGPLDGAGRRSLYLAVRRNFLSPLLLAFDTPAPFSTVGRRTVSNVPAQALILLNDPFVHQQAELWGKRVAAQDGPAGQRVRRMYLSAFGRPPTARELGSCLDYLGRQGGQAMNDPAAWTDLAHVLFNVKEFIFLN